MGGPARSTGCPAVGPPRAASGLGLRREAGDPVLGRRDAEPGVDDPEPAGLDRGRRRDAQVAGQLGKRGRGRKPGAEPEDRKSTRLNSSHLGISYAVFCLKKKKKQETQ